MYKKLFLTLHLQTEMGYDKCLQIASFFILPIIALFLHKHFLDDDVINTLGYIVLGFLMISHLVLIHCIILFICLSVLHLLFMFCCLACAILFARLHMVYLPHSECIFG